MIKPLKENAHIELDGQWYLASEDRFVRDKSKKWPKEFIEHFYSKKYAEGLFECNPTLYMKIQGIDKESEEGKELMALHTAKRMIKKGGP